MNQKENNGQEPRKLLRIRIGSPADNPARKKLLVDLQSAEGRLERSKERLRELETTTPTAFFEIKRAKDVVAAGQAIVQLYSDKLTEMDKGLDVTIREG